MASKEAEEVLVRAKKVFIMEAKEAENRGVREKSQVSTGILRALGQADWPFHTARDAGSSRQRWNLFLEGAKAQSDLTDQAE